jgi:hypothetical protein
MPTHSNDVVAANQTQADVCEAILSGRKFGVEIEFVGISRERAIEVIASVPGVRCNERSVYTHANSSTHWKVVTDGSVRPSANHGYEACGEAVSPILSGADGLEQVRKVIKALAQAGATANRSCGLHVHVDAADLTGPQFHNVLVRYSSYESEIDAFMPNSRRSSNNAFCRSMRNWVENYGRQNFPTPSAVGRVYSERYLKVNATAYERHNTVEFRQHSGTVNADKICNWIQFCVNFVQTSMSLAGGVRLDARRSSSGNRVSKTDLKMKQIILYLEASHLASTSRIAEHLTNSVSRTSETSVVVMISNLRRHYGWRIYKTNGLFRIISCGRIPGGRDSEASLSDSRPAFGSSVVTPVDSGLFMNLPAHVVAFYQERQQELSA